MSETSEDEDPQVGRPRIPDEESSCNEVADENGKACRYSRRVRFRKYEWWFGGSVFALAVMGLVFCLA